MLNKISKSYQKIKRYLVQLFYKSSTKKKIGYKIVSMLQEPLKDNLTKINIHTNKYAFLRKQVYDFQYLNSELSDNVHVFKADKDNNSYLIKGQNSFVKVFVNLN